MSAEKKSLSETVGAGYGDFWHDKSRYRVLKGGIFGLYTRNDILSASGKVLMKADTLIELKTTDADGKISFIADLPIDGT